MVDTRELFLARLLGDSKVRGEDLLVSLKAYPLLKECYGRALGGRDNHSLEEHTLKALRCYEDNFESKAEILFEPQYFKLLLAFHDLGKAASYGRRRSG